MATAKTPNLQDILKDHPHKRGSRTQKYSVEVQQARHQESQQRASLAQNKARQALTYLHHDDYRELYRQAKEQIDAERGPLPTSVNGDR